MPQLKRTESLIFELENQLLPTEFKTSLDASVPPPLAYLSMSLNPPVSNNDSINSGSTWVSLPPPAPILTKSLNGRPLQYSSPLGPSPRKLYRRIYLHSLPKPNLYRRALIACTKKAALGLRGRT
jgi:hypothetical protein